MIHQASRFVSHSLLGLGARVPVALVNSSPLRRLLNSKLQMNGIAEAIAQKQLHAVAVTAFGYESGQAVTFYQGAARLTPGCVIDESAFQPNCPLNICSPVRRFRCCSPR